MVEEDSPVEVVVVKDSSELEIGSVQILHESLNSSWRNECNCVRPLN